MHLKAVFLLIFSQMGLQPSVARVSEYYIKTFDFEMLTTSYFINETKLIENRQNVIVTKKKIMSLSLLWSTDHQYESVPREIVQNTHRDTGSSPLLPMLGWLTRLPEVFPFLTTQFPLHLQSRNRTRRWESTYVLSHKLWSDSMS